MVLFNNCADTHTSSVRVVDMHAYTSSVYKNFVMDFWMIVNAWKSARSSSNLFKLIHHDSTSGKQCKYNYFSRMAVRIDGVLG